MTRSIALLACAQALLLSACAMTAPERSPAPVTTVPQPTSPAPGSSAAGASTSTSAYRAGVGVIESASIVSLPSSGAAAGGTAARGPIMAYAIKMPDGSTQSVVQAGERFQLGDRVQVTSDGRLARP